MNGKLDPARIIARWLFYAGCVWAFVLVPCLGLVAFSAPIALLTERDPRPGLLVVYTIIGYLVWIGWYWRSRGRRSLVMALSFWIFSALFNSMFLLWGLATKPKELVGEFFSLHAYNLWWWAAASAASLAALWYEIIVSERNGPAA